MNKIIIIPYFLNLKMVQSQIKDALLKNIKNGRLPNAVCFVDKGGRGSLKLASEIGFAVVNNLNEKSNKLDHTHPDLHYIYPTKKPANESVFKKGMTAFYMDKWRAFLRTQIYGSVDDWLDFSSSDNKPAKIRVNQISEIISTLNLKPFLSDKKTCIIWGLEYLQEDSANKLLKIIEEPPEQTYFFLIAENEKKVLPTLASRCQMLRLHPLENKKNSDSFRKLEPSKFQAIEASVVSKGNLNTSSETINKREIISERERLFIDCLRGGYIAANKGDFSYIVKNSSALGSLTKFELKQFFQFGIDFIRQAFLYSEGIKELYEFETLNDFSIENFAVYVNDINYKKLVSLFDLNLGHIKRNGLFRDANSKLLSTSFLLDLSDILYKKN